MKKLFYLTFAALMMVACNDKKSEPSEPTTPDTPETPTDPVEPVNPETSFVRKHLIEEFTGQGCGYCPAGMDLVSEFIGSDTTFITVLHHTYGRDNFTIAPSQTIANAFNCSSAPNVSLDRVQYDLDDEVGLAYYFHPYYLSHYSFNLAKETYASVKIQNTYDEASRQLQVHVSGKVLAEQAPALKLTVLIKESGMIDYQSDFYDTYDGWTEFRHVNAARAFLTEAFGNDLTISNGAYSVDFTTAIEAGWNPNNCSVVAFLTTAEEVIQAEQRPVVAGTKGGADIKHEGITSTPLPDNYPEPTTGVGPLEVMNVQPISLTNSEAYYEYLSDYNLNLWHITAVNTSVKYAYGSNQKNLYPYVDIQLITRSNVTSLSAGSYLVSTEGETGSVYAGGLNPRNGQVWGSQFYLIYAAMYSLGTITPKAQWLLVDGELVIDEMGAWTFIGHTRAGKSIEIQGTEIINKGLRQQ